MEPEYKPPKNLKLLNAIAPQRNLRAAPRTWLEALDRRTRADGTDLERNEASFAQHQEYTATIEKAVNFAPDVTERSSLYAYAADKFDEMFRDLLYSDAGRAALKATGENVETEAKRRQAVAAARVVAANEARLREHDAAIAAEVRGVNVDSMLDAIGAAGVDLGIVGNEIHAVPAGKLSVVQRRVFTERRDEVLARLQQRNQAETL
ncbi:MAG TPA: hypothetical protein VJX68_09450 [Candidatus Binatus sp.]|uniref:hypothetical protein n=1 Tax=Candidatus Binatus sp. TaxID=2811406 RepID=UPI002B46B994|nr:hypothetical protein [Candidatus Binatus sp.]HKN13409.1 hypothetical protein [Candidatus Binatus sp.]